MALITYTDMIESAGKSVTEAGALFKNPVGEGLSDLSTVGFSMGFLEKCVAPPPDPGVYVEPTLEASVSSLTSQISSHISQKMENLPKDLALAVAAEQNALTISSIDAKASGDMSGGVDPIKATFTDEGGCPVTDAAFKTITDTPSLLSGIKQGVESSLAAVSGIGFLYQSVSAVVGTTITSAGQLMDAIAAATTSGAQAAVEQAIRSTSQAYPSIISGITTVVSNASNIISDAQESFTTLVSTELDALTGITKQINGMQIVSLLNSNSTCVKNVMSSVVRPETVNPIVLDTLKAPSEFVIPKEEAVAVVMTGQPISNLPPPDTLPPPAPPSVDSQQYSTEELAAMKSIVAAKQDDWFKAQEAAAIYYADNIAQWKNDVGYLSIRHKAGWNADQGIFNDGATTKQIQEYQNIEAAYQSRKDYYNTIYVRDMNEKKEIYRQHSLEYHNRNRYGRNVYVNMAEQGVLGMKPSDKTTYLDSSV